MPIQMTNNGNSKHKLKLYTQTKKSTRNIQERLKTNKPRDVYAEDLRKSQEENTPVSEQVRDSQSLHNAKRGEKRTRCSR